MLFKNYLLLIRHFYDLINDYLLIKLHAVPLQTPETLT